MKFRTIAWFLFVLICFAFEPEFCCVIWDGLELTQGILLPQPSEHWDYRPTSSHLATFPPLSFVSRVFGYSHRSL